jgi:glycosyltransferase involved in cell wall biosynthesis
MKRVLFVSYVFPPLLAGGSARVGQFARYLPEFGWAVTVVTGTAGEPGTGKNGHASLPLPREVELVRAWFPERALGRRGAQDVRTGFAGASRAALRQLSRWVAFPDRQLVWIPGAVRKAVAAARRAPHDAVFASYPPASSLLAGALAAQATGLPLVVDFRDLWSEYPGPSFASPMHRRSAAYLEHLVCARAARIVGVTPSMADHLARAHGRASAEVCPITNGFDPDDVARVHDARSAGNRAFRLVYTGSVNPYHDLGPLWGALRSLLADGSISQDTFRVEFVGNLSPRDVDDAGVGDVVEMRPFVPHHEVFEALAQADALLVIETPGYYKEFSYAAKVFDYALTGKPVLALVERASHTARLLDQLGVGIPAAVDDASSIREGLLRAYAQKGRPPRPVRVDEPPLQAFNRRWLTSQLARVLDEASAAV